MNDINLKNIANEIITEAKKPKKVKPGKLTIQQAIIMMRNHKISTCPTSNGKDLEVWEKAKEELKKSGITENNPANQDNSKNDYENGYNDGFYQGEHDGDSGAEYQDPLGKDFKGKSEDYYNGWSKGYDEGFKKWNEYWKNFKRSNKETGGEYDKGEFEKFDPEDSDFNLDPEHDLEESENANDKIWDDKGEEITANTPPEEDSQDALYVTYIRDRQGEDSFMLGGKKYQYVTGKYPDGRLDVAVYSFAGDICYGYNAFRKMHNINECPVKMDEVDAPINNTYDEGYMDGQSDGEDAGVDGSYDNPEEIDLGKCTDEYRRGYVEGYNKGYQSINDETPEGNEPPEMSDVEADADTLASAGMGNDEDYLPGTPIDDLGDDTGIDESLNEICNHEWKPAVSDIELAKKGSYECAHCGEVLTKDEFEKLKDPKMFPIGREVGLRLQNLTRKFPEITGHKEKGHVYTHQLRKILQPKEEGCDKDMGAINVNREWDDPSADDQVVREGKILHRKKDTLQYASDGMYYLMRGNERINKLEMTAKDAKQRNVERKKNGIDLLWWYSGCWQQNESINKQQLKNLINEVLNDPNLVDDKVISDEPESIVAGMLTIEKALVMIKTYNIQSCPNNNEHDTKVWEIAKNQLNTSDKAAVSNITKDQLSNDKDTALKRVGVQSEPIGLGSDENAQEHIEVEKKTEIQTTPSGEVMKKTELTAIIKECVAEVLLEKKDKKKWIQKAVHPSKEGMFSGKTAAEIASMLRKAKEESEVHQKKGEKVPDELRKRISQLVFAARAKKKGGLAKN